MGLEQFEWKQIDTENPQAIIDDWSRWGWKVHSIKNRERVVRSHHSGTSVSSSTGSGSLGSYGGSTTFEREYWTELILVRDPKRQPFYHELVQCERTWNAQEPALRPVREAGSGIGTFILWYIPVFLILGIATMPLKAWDAYDAWGAANEGLWWFLFSIVCALICLPAAIRASRKKGDTPHSKEELETHASQWKAYDQARKAALERATAILEGRYSPQAARRADGTGQ